MPLPTALGSYADIKQLLDSCLAQRTTATLTFPSRAARTRFRSRFYYYRKLLAADSFGGVTPYDNIVMRDGEQDNQLFIDFQQLRNVQVTFTSPDATLQPPIIPTAKEPDLDPLLNIALEIGKKL